MNIKLLLNLHKNQEYNIHKSIWQMPWMHCVQICKVNQYSLRNYLIIYLFICINYAGMKPFNQLYN